MGAERLLGRKEGGLPKLFIIGDHHGALGLEEHDADRAAFLHGLAPRQDATGLDRVLGVVELPRAHEGKDHRQGERHHHPDDAQDDEHLDERKSVSFRTAHATIP